MFRRGGNSDGKPALPVRNGPEAAPLTRCICHSQHRPGKPTQPARKQKTTLLSNPEEPTCTYALKDATSASYTMGHPDRKYLPKTFIICRNPTYSMFGYFGHVGLKPRAACNRSPKGATCPCFTSKHYVKKRLHPMYLAKLLGITLQHLPEPAPQSTKSVREVQAARVIAMMAPQGRRVRGQTQTTAGSLPI